MIIAYDELPADVRECIPAAFNLAVDPKAPWFPGLWAACHLLKERNQGTPCNCLIATVGHVASGRRMSLNFEHETETETTDGILKLFLGDGYAAVKRLPASNRLVKVGQRFDQDIKPRVLVSEHVNLHDGSWTFTYRQSSGGRKTPENNQGRGDSNALIKRVRARTLADIREAEQAAS